MDVDAPAAHTGIPLSECRRCYDAINHYPILRLVAYVSVTHRLRKLSAVILLSCVVVFASIMAALISGKYKLYAIIGAVLYQHYQHYKLLKYPYDYLDCGWYCIMKLFQGFHIFAIVFTALHDDSEYPIYIASFTTFVMAEICLPTFYCCMQQHKHINRYGRDEDYTVNMELDNLANRMLIDRM